MIQTRRDDETQVSHGPLIMIVEDDPELRQLLGYVLRHDGHRVVELPSGEDALEYITSSVNQPGSHELPDLLICDIAMPRFSGFDLLQEIADMADFRIIAMTAFGDPHVHARARSLGADLCFDKPFDLAALREAVRGIWDSD